MDTSRRPDGASERRGGTLTAAEWVAVGCCGLGIGFALAIITLATSTVAVASLLAVDVVLVLGVLVVLRRHRSALAGTSTD